MAIVARAHPSWCRPEAGAPITSFLFTTSAFVGNFQTHLSHSHFLVATFVFYFTSCLRLLNCAPTLVRHKPTQQ